MAVYKPRKGDAMVVDITPMTPAQKAQYVRDLKEKEWDKLRRNKPEIQKISQKFREKVARDIEKLKGQKQ